jgi:hypothetical protein
MFTLKGRDGSGFDDKKFCKVTNQDIIDNLSLPDLHDSNMKEDVFVIFRLEKAGSLTLEIDILFLVRTV